MTEQTPRSVWVDPWRGDVLVVGRLTFEMTCAACPEQYDVWLGERQEQIGYVRARHGVVTAEYPDACERLVYRADLVDSDGDLGDEHERRRHLTAIAALLEDAHSGGTGTVDVRVVGADEKEGGDANGDPQR